MSATSGLPGGSLGGEGLPEPLVQPGLAQAGVVARNERAFGHGHAVVTAVGIGYDVARLTEFLAQTDFDEFYDPPEPRMRPYPGSAGVPVADTSLAARAFMKGDFVLWLGALIAGDAPSFTRSSMGGIVATSVVARILQTVEDVAYVPEEDFLSIEGFDEDLAKELRERANVFLTDQEEKNANKRKELGVSDEIAAIPGITKRRRH